MVPCLSLISSVISLLFLNFDFIKLGLISHFWLFWLRVCWSCVLFLRVSSFFVDSFIVFCAYFINFSSDPYYFFPRNALTLDSAFFSSALRHIVIVFIWALYDFKALFFTYFVCTCMHSSIYVSMCVEVRGQPSGVDSHFPSYGSWALSSDCWQVLLPADPSHPPSLIFLIF